MSSFRFFMLINIALTLAVSWTCVDAAELPLITPPKLSSDQVQVKLPAAVEDTAVAGGGRFLCFHLKSLRKVAVFDVNEAKIVKYLSADDDDVLIAGGADKLIILLCDKNIITRWSLKSFEREVAAPLQFSHRVGTMSMGSGSAGPLLLTANDQGNNVASNGGCLLYDIEKMKPLPTTIVRKGHIHWTRNVPVIASLNGQLFAVAYSGSHTLRLRGNKIDANSSGDYYGVLVPGPLGRYLYGATTPVTGELKSLGRDERGNSRQTMFNQLLPALRGPYYISLKATEDFNAREPQPYRVSIHMAGDTKSLITGPDIGIKFNMRNIGRNKNFPLYKRVFFISEANLFVAIGDSKEEIILTKYDVEKSLDNSEIDYLYVSSQPPARVEPGDEFTYKIDVRSKRGDVKLKLETGPEGMKLSPDGHLTWKVPDNYSQPEASVILTITDASQQEIFHPFKVSVGNNFPATTATTTLPGAEEEEKLRRRKAWLASKEKAIAQDDKSKPRLASAIAFPLRTWTDAAGEELQAKFAKAFAAQVILVRASGAEISIPIKQLSAADKEYVQKQIEVSRQFRKQARQRELERLMRQGSPEERAKLQEQSKTNMKHIALALVHYADVHKTFPPQATLDLETGEPLLSWRVLLLPYLEQAELYKQFHLDEPWYSEHNKKLIDKMPEIFRAPGSGAAETRTNYVTVVDQRNIFRAPPENYRSIPTNMRSQLMRGISFAAMRDGTAHTVAFIEADDTFAATWTRPDGIPMASLSDFQAPFGLRDKGMLAAFGDAHVELISKENSNETLRALFTRDGREVFELVSP